MILASYICKSQNWNLMNGSSDLDVSDIIEYNEDTLLAGVDNNGIYISYDGGSFWSPYALQNETVHSLIKIGNSIMAGTDNGIFKSNMINSQWNNILSNNLVVSTLKVNNDTVFACSYSTTGPGAIYISVDTGSTWNQYGTTPPYAFLDIDFNPDGRIHVATPYGAYYSENQSPWILTSGNGTTTWSVTYIENDTVLYGTGIGIYLSTDNGVSSDKLDNISGRSTFYINDTIYVATDGELKYSNNLNQNWSSTGLFETVNILTKIGQEFFAGTTSGIYTNSLITRTDESIRRSVRILPNPITSVFRIIGIESSKLTVDIYNISGQKIFTSHKLNNDISQLESGIYFVRINQKNNLISKRIIKK